LTYPSEAAPRRRFRWAWPLAVTLLLFALLAVYAARKVIARDVLTGWLRSHGVASAVQIDELGLSHMGGRVRLGAAEAPDFAAADVAVIYGLRGLSFELLSVTLRQPVLRARLHDGRVSLGGLDPLIADVLKRPPTPGAPKPRIEIDQGVLLLVSDYGPVRLTADAVVSDGRLVSLTARSDPARLRGGAFDVAVGTMAGSLRTRGDRVSLALDVPVASVRAGGLTGAPMRLRLIGEAPYPDLKHQGIDGPLVLHADLTGEQVDLAGATFTAPAIVADFQGAAGGGIADLALVGTMTADLRSRTAAFGATRSGAIRLQVKADDLHWTRRAGVISATPRVTALLHDLVAGSLHLSQLLTDGGGAVRYGPGGVQADLKARLDGRGAWSGLGPGEPSDAPQVAVLRRAAKGFQISAPDVSLSLDQGGARVGLPQPLQIRADQGGTAEVSARGAEPVFSAQRGAFRLAVSGGSLPTLNADVRRLQVLGGVVTAQGNARVAGSIGPLEDGKLMIDGVLRVANDGVSLSASGCAPLSARRLVFGANDLEGVTGRLCPDEGPLFVSGRGGSWLRAKAEGLGAAAPFLQARIVDGSGRVVVQQAAGKLRVTATVGHAQVLDMAPQKRFNPLQVGGRAGVADGVFTADLRFATPAGQPVATAALRHDTVRSKGGLTLDTSALVFADNGLQPSQLSPLAEVLGGPVRGQARFVGRFAWTPESVESDGTLSVKDLDFGSSLGRVSGLKGDIVFTSLSPLTAAPSQTLHAAAVAAAVPLTGLTASFALDGKALTVSSGEAAVGGGKVRVETLEVPLAADRPISGVLVVEGVQLHDLVEASPFGDRMDLDARVSGHVPFQSQAGKIQIAGADLHAIQPGRLSISRQALTATAAGGSVSASTGAVAPVQPNDTFTDFAYQAMENLAFDKLDAGIDSRSDGRLGILAHIVGRHDPPQHQEIRLSLFDLIGRKFLTKPLPLPSDTGVDLTLDTTLNLDELLADYADYRRLRGSPAVQPAEATTKAKLLETPR
jgi:hypothetical protein